MQDGGLKGHQGPFLIVCIHFQSCKVMQAPLDISFIEILRKEIFFSLPTSERGALYYTH